MCDIRSEGEYREDSNKSKCCDLDVAGEIWLATSDKGESDLNIIKDSAVWFNLKLSGKELWWFKISHLAAVLCAGDSDVEVSDSAIASEPVSFADFIVIISLREKASRGAIGVSLEGAEPVGSPIEFPSIEFFVREKTIISSEGNIEVIQIGLIDDSNVGSREATVWYSTPGAWCVYWEFIDIASNVRRVSEINEVFSARSAQSILWIYRSAAVNDGVSLVYKSARANIAFTCWTLCYVGLWDGRIEVALPWSCCHGLGGIRVEAVIIATTDARGAV